MSLTTMIMLLGLDMPQPEQATRNAAIKTVPAELLEQCTIMTEALRVAYLGVGGQVDPCKLVTPPAAPPSPWGRSYCRHP